MPLKSYIETHLKNVCSVYGKKCGVYFVNMATAFRRLPTTSEVYRLMFEGVSRRRRRRRRKRLRSFLKLICRTINENAGHKLLSRTTCKHDLAILMNCPPKQ